MEGRGAGNQTSRCHVCELIKPGQQIEDGGAEGLFRGIRHINDGGGGGGSLDDSNPILKNSALSTSEELHGGNTPVLVEL